MKRVRFLYLLLMIGLTFFAIMFRDHMSSVLWAMMLVLPGIIYAVLRLSIVKLKVQLSVGSRTVYPNSPVKVSLSVINGFILPITRCEVKLKCKYHYYEEENELSLNTPVFIDNVQTTTFTVYPKHLGKIYFTVDELVVYDFLGMFKIKVPYPCKCEVNVMPDMERNNILISRAFYFKAEESDSFSQERGGDDPSEIFQIREYREGDKLQRIHWKLSAKKDDMMYKEGSLPIQTSATMFVDLYYDRAAKNKKEYIDTTLLTLTTLSTAFLRERLEHNISWYNLATGDLMVHRVVSDDDLFLVISELYASLPYDTEHKTMRTALEYQASQLNVRPIYVAPNIPEGVFELMDNAMKASLITFEVGDFAETYGESDKFVGRTICIDCLKPDLALDNLVL